MHLRAALAVGCAALVGGCGHGRMVPSTSASVVEGAPAVAVADDRGVEVSADAQGWESRPQDLPERLTPVKVRIVNHSGGPVEVLYERFLLAGAHGRQYQPLPPVPIDHQTPVDGAGTVRPIFAAAGFFVAQRYRDIYPSLPPWSQPISRETGFSERQYRRWPGDLPTREMQRMGLPEGVLAEGGEISGFLFFEDATRRDSRLTFKATLEDAGRPVANIEIPFRVE